MLSKVFTRGLSRKGPAFAGPAIAAQLASLAQAAPLLAVVDHVQLQRAGQALPALSSFPKLIPHYPAQLRGFAAPSQNKAEAPRKQDPSTPNVRQTPSADAEAKAEADAEAAGAQRVAQRAAEEGEAILASREIDKGTYWLMQPVYKKEYVESVKPKHLPPNTAMQRLAYWAIQTVRTLFDKVTGYGPNMNEALWLRRIVFLETVAGVPGMVGGMLRHMSSLRNMRRDHGWIHTLLEEAENERMHLLTFLTLRQPGVFFRSMVLVAQGVFFNFFFLTYLVSPRYCHAFVGYLEEEAVKTYTHALADLDAGKLPEWEKLQAPEVAKKYWKLAPDAGMRELLLAVRADEAGHSHVNHTLSQLRKDEPNPFAPGSHAVP